MQKLLTPQQYESTLDELNEIRPLQVSDIVKQFISMPVCNRYANSESKASDGVFVKSTHHGHILNHKHRVLTQYQKVVIFRTAGEHNIENTFNQRVYRVLINTKVLDNVNRLYWGRLGSVFSIQDYNSIGIHQVNLIGDYICINASIAAEGFVNFDLYGFY